jgi:hypothetical protein
MAKSNYEHVKEWRKRFPWKRTEEARRYRAKHWPEIKERQRRWKQRNIDRVRSMDAAAARRRRADPEGNRRRIAKFKAKAEARRVEMAGRPRAESCELCGEVGRTVFDHCHAKGHFRGWICDRCNKVLGLVKDDVRLLRTMASYLETADGAHNNGKTEVAEEFAVCLTGQR